VNSEIVGLAPGFGCILLNWTKKIVDEKLTRKFAGLATLPEQSHWFQSRGLGLPGCGANPGSFYFCLFSHRPFR
jgi:hypothetical protein